MRRALSITVLILVFAMVGVAVWVSNNLNALVKPARSQGVESQIAQPASLSPTGSESLLAGYGDPETAPMEDLRKIQHVAVGYFSVIKDAGRFPIGGNADFSAALRGENPNREVFVRPGHPVFSTDGLLIDRWGRPLVIHPEAWRELELRSAGPDGVPYNADDLILAPAGNSLQPK